jgi:hypothetical protein
MQEKASKHNLSIESTFRPKRDMDTLLHMSGAHFTKNQSRLAFISKRAISPHIYLKYSKSIASHHHFSTHMTKISQIAKETQIRHMKEAQHPKMQYDTNAT